MLSHMLRAAATKGGYPVNFITTASSAVNLTNYTFNSVDFGDEDANREVFVLVTYGSFALSARALNSMTIGGITATKAANAADAISGAACFYATVPTGTSGSVTLNFSGGVLRCAISVFNVINRPNISSQETAVSHISAGSGESISITDTVPNNGFSLGMLSQNTSDITGSLSSAPYTQVANFSYADGPTSYNNVFLYDNTSGPEDISTKEITWSGSAAHRAIFITFN